MLHFQLRKNRIIRDSSIDHYLPLPFALGGQAVVSCAYELSAFRCSQLLSLRYQQTFVSATRQAHANICINRSLVHLLS
mgnify:CR=1 FL=1